MKHEMLGLKNDKKCVVSPSGGQKAEIQAGQDKSCLL